MCIDREQFEHFPLTALSYVSTLIDKFFISQCTILQLCAINSNTLPELTHWVSGTLLMQWFLRKAQGFRSSKHCNSFWGGLGSKSGGGVVKSTKIDVANTNCEPHIVWLCCMPMGEWLRGASCLCALLYMFIVCAMNLENSEISVLAMTIIIMVSWSQRFKWFLMEIILFSALYSIIISQPTSGYKYMFYRNKKIHFTASVTSSRRLHKSLKRR